MNLFQSRRVADFSAKLFAAAGLNLDTLCAAGDEFALKAHIEQLVAKAAAKTVEPTDEELHALVSAELSSHLKTAGLGDGTDPLAALGELSGQIADHRALKAALAAAKIEIKTAADLPAALQSRISTAAGEELAKRGIRDFPAQNIVEDPTKAAAEANAPKLTGLARVHAAFSAPKTTSK